MIGVNLMPKKILIIDDESRIVEICQDYLQAAAFDVISASNGADGLMAFRRERPDLIILDLMLPDISGFDLCRAIRRENDLPIPHIARRRHGHPRVDRQRPSEGISARVKLAIGSNGHVVARSRAGG